MNTSSRASARATRMPWLLAIFGVRKNGMVLVKVPYSTALAMVCDSARPAMAAWNERRLMRDLYDAWFFLRMGIRPDEKTLARRLQKPEYSRLVKVADHFKGATVEDFRGFLLAHVQTLTDADLAAELKDYLRADELAGLGMRIRAEFAKW